MQAFIIGQTHKVLYPLIICCRFTRLNAKKCMAIGRCSHSQLLMWEFRIYTWTSNGIGCPMALMIGSFIVDNISIIDQRSKQAYWFNPILLA